MRHQAKTQGFWGWVVLGLCALAVLAGAYQSTRAKSTKDPQALETPNIIADQTDPKGDDAEEVSVPVTIPVLPEKPEVPVSGETEEPAEPVIASAPRIIVPPLTGETVAAFSADALQYNDTLADWRTHEGLDIAAAEGTEVCAACAGTTRIWKRASSTPSIPSASTPWSAINQAASSTPSQRSITPAARSKPQASKTG